MWDCSANVGSALFNKKGLSLTHSSILYDRITPHSEKNSIVHPGCFNTEHCRLVYRAREGNSTHNCRPVICRSKFIFILLIYLFLVKDTEAVSLVVQGWSFCKVDESVKHIQDLKG